MRMRNGEWGMEDEDRGMENGERAQSKGNEKNIGKKKTPAYFPV